VSTLRAANRRVSARMIASVVFAFGLVHRGDEGPSGQDFMTCASLMRGVSAARIGRMDLHAKSTGGADCVERHGWLSGGENL